MQIDFHHAVTYLSARLAGYTAAEAEVIAHAAQYVDDSVTENVIDFNSGARFNRIASAHRMLDLQNMSYADGLKVWQPFHFLAGNGNLARGSDPAGSFIQKLICRPDSQIAREMVYAAFADVEKSYALHRIGIAMHVYADTWAHQGFAGTHHTINDISNVEAPALGTVERIQADLLEKAAPPVGHGQAGVLPDMPFLQWGYTNGLGERVERDNTALFCDAADSLCQMMQRFRAKDYYAEAKPIDSANMAAIRNLFQTLTDEDGDKRHAAWLAAIADGKTFVVDGKGMAEKPSYAADGATSWIWQALGTDQDQPAYDMQPGFGESHWACFQSAAQAHRFAVLHDILPKYGIFVG